MTEAPPFPPPGNPPPTDGGLPPSGYPGYPPQPPPWVLPTSAYTPWSKRLWAFLIDWIPILLLVVSPVAYLLVGQSACSDFRYGLGSPTRSYEFFCTQDSTYVEIALQCSGLLLAAVYFFFNFGYREGRTGQSIGKTVLKFQVISEKTWRPIGFWLSIVRQIAHQLDHLVCYVGYLFPLWDDKRQTFADKLMTTVCVARDQPPPASAPDYQSATRVQKRALAPWLVAGVVLLFLGVCGTALALGSTASSSIGSAARTGVTGDLVSDGTFQFVITDFGRSSLQSDATGEHFIAWVVVTNTGNEPQSFAAQNQKLIDRAGHAYGAAEVSAAFSQQQTTILDVKPGLILRVFMRFDAPKGTKPTSIELHDSTSSAGATVSVH